MNHHRWCDSAVLRKRQIESGDDLTFNLVFKPWVRQTVLAVSPGSVLEVGAGTGHLSKDLAEHVEQMTAIEPSNGMFNIAAEVLEDTGVNLINCSSYDLAVSSRFDVVVSNMVLQAVDNVFEFLISVSRHMGSGGHFVFSIPHPCFYNEYKGFFGSEYKYMEEMQKEVSFSISLDPENTIANVPYHHRPLSEYFHCLKRAGFTVDNFEEVFPPEEVQDMYGEVWDTPRYCGFVCKKN